MSGQPVQTASDQNKFRNEYMENLNLESQIQDMNFQANKVYIQSGQLPPQAQMPDTRSTAEKLKDIEFLKKSIIQELRPIAEPQFALDIYNRVEQHPLNVDGGFLRWLAQNATEIGKQLSKKYKFGIAGDINDAEIIVQFMAKAFSETKNSFQSIKSFLNSRSSAMSSTNIISTNDIDNITRSLTDIQKQLTISGFRNPANEQIIGNIITVIREIKEVLPTTEQLNYILNSINENTQGEISGALLSDAFEILDKLPTASTINSLLITLKKAVDSNNNILAQSVLTKIENEFADFIGGRGGANIDILRHFRREFLRPFQESMDRERATADKQLNIDIERENQAERENKKANRVYVVNPFTDPVPIAQGVGPRNLPGLPLQAPFRDINDYNAYVQNQNIIRPGFVPGNRNIIQRNYNFFRNRGQQAGQALFNVLNNIMRILNMDRENAFRLACLGVFMSYMQLEQKMESEYKQNPHDDNITNIERELDEIENEVPPLLVDQSSNYPSNNIIDEMSNLPIFEQQPEMSLYPISIPQIDFYDQSGYNKYTGDSMNKPGGYVPYQPPSQIGTIQPPLNITSGKGLKTRKGRPRGGSIVPMPKKPAFIGFGINEIDQFKLDKNILSIRRNTRSKIKGMGNKHISEPMKRIIKNFIGGSVPNYNDLSSLDNEEKEYLNKIVEHSDLKDRLSVPAPSKDQREKDFHSFEVMKGEILAGNDSKELIKKFKLLMIKLSRQNLLPKSEVQELMEELVELGY